MRLQRWFAEKLPIELAAGKSLLVVVPPPGWLPSPGELFAELFNHYRPAVTQLDLLVALGDAPPMSDMQIARWLGIDPAERMRLFFQTRFFNHNPDEPGELTSLGTVPSPLPGPPEFSNDIPLAVNSRLLQYDLVLTLSAVAPQPGNGWSGGVSDLLPGLANAEFIDAVQRWVWSDAAPSDDCAGEIGQAETPLSCWLTTVSRRLPCAVHSLLMAWNFPSAEPPQSDELEFGEVDSAWSRLTERLTERLQQTPTTAPPKPVEQVLVVVPSDIPDLWTASRCLPYLARHVQTDGEVILYAPHIRHGSLTYGSQIMHNPVSETAAHPAAPDQTPHATPAPRGPLSPWIDWAPAENATPSQARFRITLATQLTRKRCQKLGCAFLDPDEINPRTWAEQAPSQRRVIRNVAELFDGWV